MTVTRNRERSPCCKLSAIFSMSSSVSALISALVNPKDERSSRLTENTSYLWLQSSEFNAHLLLAACLVLKHTPELPAHRPRIRRYSSSQPSYWLYASSVRL